jgi:hypothetical protein
MTAFGVKMWAECLLIVISHELGGMNLKLTKLQPIYGNLYNLPRQLILQWRRKAYDRGSCESPHLVEVSYSDEHCSYSVLV